LPVARPHRAAHVAVRLVIGGGRRVLVSAEAIDASTLRRCPPDESSLGGPGGVSPYR